MLWKFPTIEHINDVLPAIKDDTHFVVAERENFTVINYLVVSGDTFPDVTDVNSALRRECRGLIFCSKTGRILRRPLVKFFNVGERDETQIHRLDFTRDHKVYTKIDGSMIVPFEVGYGSGNIRWGTKMGLSDVALKAEVFVAKNPKYMDFAKWCISQDISPIFEYVGPNNRIVVKYEKEDLVLLTARHMITGEYLNVSL